jgi:hypothetical protein
MSIISYGSHTARRLAAALGVSHVVPYGERTNLGRVRQGRLRRPINYGCRYSRVPMTPDTINIAAESAMSKYAVLQLWHQAGLRCPALIDPATATQPYLARRDGLSQGHGITLCQPGEEQTEPYDFCVELVPNQREYRVHVILGEVRLVAYKTVPENYPHVARVHRLGCMLVPSATVDVSPEVEHLCLAAVRTLSLDFGAVDVLETPDGVPYLLEVNTAPGLTRAASLAAYVDVFRTLSIQE